MNGLSNREREVMDLIVQGFSNQEIAQKLFVCEKTIKFHITNIFLKMNVRSRAQLIVHCVRQSMDREELDFFKKLLG